MTLMKKSAIFNRQHPAPFDRHVLPVYKDFLALQKEVLTLWQQDVVNNHLRARGFVDLTTSRIDVKANGEVVISLKPVIGFEIQEQLKFYTRFFTFYTAYQAALLEVIQSGIEIKAYLKRQNESKAQGDAWLAALNHSIHTMAVILKIMVTAMRDETLTNTHLDILDRTSTGDSANLIRSINQMVKDLNLTGTLSDKFIAGGDFFEDPDPELIASYWEYGYKANKREIEKNAKFIQRSNDTASTV
jgi:hypothetical protein